MEEYKLKGIKREEVTQDQIEVLRFLVLEECQELEYISETFDIDIESLYEWIYQ